MTDRRALALFRSEVVDPLVATSSDGTVDAKDLLKQLKAAMKRGPSAMAVAALCLTSTSGRVAHDKLTAEAIVDMFQTSFDERRGPDGRVSLAAACSSDTFQAWATATGFDPAAAAVNDASDVNHQLIL